MGYPGPNVATNTILKRAAAPIVCQTFRPASRDNTRCSLCAYAIWEHAKFSENPTAKR